MLNSHTLATAALYFTILPVLTSFGPPTLKGKGLSVQHQYNEMKCNRTVLLIDLYVHNIHITSNTIKLHEMSSKESFLPTLLCCYNYDHYKRIHTQRKGTSFHYKGIYIHIYMYISLSMSVNLNKKVK